MEQHTHTYEDTIQQSHKLQLYMKQKMTQQTLLYLNTEAEVHASSSSHCFAFNHTAYICVLLLLLHLCEEHINYQH
jgi:hypothetical protein